MIFLAYLVLFLLTGGLFVVTTTRIAFPTNLVTDGIVFACILGVCIKLFGFGVITWLLAVWMVAIVGGLYGARTYLRNNG